MNTLSTIFTALASASVVLALKGCPNGGTGVGLRTICVGGGNPDSGFTGTCNTWAVISKDGTCNINAQKTASSYSDMCGRGYNYGASVGCDGSGNVNSINPPGEGIVTRCTTGHNIQCGLANDEYGIFACCN